MRFTFRDFGMMALGGAAITVGSGLMLPAASIVIVGLVMFLSGLLLVAKT